jgi:hypothetical protein
MDKHRQRSNALRHAMDWDLLRKIFADESHNASSGSLVEDVDSSSTKFELAKVL